MGICESIEADHVAVAALFDELTPLAADDRRTTETMRLATRLTVSIKTHALAEEKVLYEALRTAGDQLAAWALEGPHALHALEVVIDKLLTLRPGAQFRAVLAVARRLFEQHAHHEARELLPVMTATLPDDECAQLGRDLDAEKRRVRPLVVRRLGSPSLAA
jgi:hypothetical protein